MEKTTTTMAKESYADRQIAFTKVFKVEVTYYMDLEEFTDTFGDVYDNNEMKIKNAWAKMIDDRDGEGIELEAEEEWQHFENGEGDLEIEKDEIKEKIEQFLPDADDVEELDPDAEHPIDAKINAFLAKHPQYASVPRNCLVDLLKMA